jgi:glutamate/tyrosine decarboxylase-like PLP-dependent enzyme
MSATTDTQLEHTLDPQDWSSVRTLGHRMVDEMLAFLENVRERPAWQRVPDEVRERLSVPVPQEPQGAESVYRDFKNDVLPYPLGVHPRFWAWVHGNCSPTGMLAEMLCGAMNSSLHAGEHSAVYVEHQVLSWMKEALGYPAEASGLLVTGGSMANFIGLAVARNSQAGWDIKNEGMYGAPGPLVVYGSTETHSSVQKSVETLGLGKQGLRYIEVDHNFRILIDALKAAVAADRNAGKVPICVVGNAGTVNSGAIDDLSALAEFCRVEGLWFHVDGAFGAIAAITPEFRPLLSGMEQADSLAFDLHKWMYMPYDVGCTLVRSPEKHLSTFSYEAAYLNSQDRGLASGPIWFSHYGLELSRGFRALKIWFCLKEYGLKTYQALVEQNVAQAKYLGELVAADPRLELLAPVSLNIVCFRFKGGLKDDQLNLINQELLLRLQESGVAVLSSTLIAGRFALRAANVNHRSRREDFEILMREVIRIGEDILREG